MEGKSSVESTGYMAIPPLPGPPVFRYNETSNADYCQKDADADTDTDTFTFTSTTRSIVDIEQSTGTGSRNRREPSSWEDSPV